MLLFPTFYLSASMSDTGQVPKSGDPAVSGKPQRDPPRKGRPPKDPFLKDLDAETTQLQRATKKIISKPNAAMKGAIVAVLHNEAGQRPKVFLEGCAKEYLTNPYMERNFKAIVANIEFLEAERQTAERAQPRGVRMAQQGEAAAPVAKQPRTLAKSELLKREAQVRHAKWDKCVPVAQSHFRMLVHATLSSMPMVAINLFPHGAHSRLCVCIALCAGSCSTGGCQA